MHLLRALFKALLTHLELGIVVAPVPEELGDDLVDDVVVVKEFHTFSAQ